MNIIFTILLSLVFIPNIKVQMDVRKKIIKTIKKDLNKEYNYSFKEIRDTIKKIKIIPVYRRRLDSVRINEYSLNQSIISYLRPYNRKISLAYVYEDESLIGVCSYDIFNSNKGGFLYFINGDYKYKEEYQNEFEYILSNYDSSTYLFEIEELTFSIWIDNGKKIMVYDTESNSVYTPQEFLSKYHTVEEIKKNAKMKYPRAGVIIKK